MPLPLSSALRRRLAHQLFEWVAGPEGPRRRERLETATGPRWFGDDRPILRVHADAAMFVGGLRALLLQSLHPLAMAGVAAHSGYRGDPWGRLQRTGHFLAVTTFGSAPDAEAMVARIKKIHGRVNGTAPDGRYYSASDPHLLKWVHVVEVDSFLRAYQRYGEQPLEAAECDSYVEDTARVAEALGVIEPPMTVVQLREQLNAFRPELAGTPEARSAARFMLLNPPVPLLFRAAYPALGGAAVGLLPIWARLPLWLPYLPVTEAVAGRAAGELFTRTVRWAMTPAESTAS
jgi:uncharacterized protein (DUF2236 family)